MIIKNLNGDLSSLAFFLSVISTAKADHVDRETVDLVWFPTGGGKTEAYLLIIAFEIFYRRLNNEDDEGVVVFMRYTLRLLTADQFQEQLR